MKKSKFEIRRTINVEQWGKITAESSTLNSISLVLRESAKLNERIGADATARLRKRQAKQIYDGLAKTGFYED